LLLVTATAFSAPHNKDGFSGFIDVGLLSVSSTDTLMVAGDNEKIDTLSDNPDRFNRGRLIALVNLKYKKGNLLYHAGTPMEEVSPQLLVGTTMLNGASSYDISVIFGIFGKVWEDPYVADRDSTSKQSTGLRFKAEGIAGSKFGAEIKLMSHDIDNDTIGGRFSSMKRDGNTYNIKGEYKYPIGNKSIITPFVEYKKEHRLGDAVSSDAVIAGAKYMQRTSKGFIMPMVNVYTEKFDADDAIFNKTRKDSGAGAFLMYRHNFTPKVHASVMLGGFIRKSNIDFYDAETVLTAVTAGYNF